MPHVHLLLPVLLRTLLPSALALLSVWPVLGVQAATAAPMAAASAAHSTLSAPSSTPAPVLREAAMPRRTPAIVLPSVDSLRAAADAEAPRKQAGTVGDRPAVAVPAVVLPAAEAGVAERRRASSRGFLPPLPVTAPPVSPAAALAAAAAASQVASPAPQPAPVEAAGAQVKVPDSSPPSPLPASAAADPSPGQPVVADIPPVARPVPPPDPNSPDPLERLRARLKERLAAVKPPDAASPYELQVSTRAVATAAATRSGGQAAGARRAAAKRPVAKPLGEGQWAYEGDNGPAAWGGLCASGKRQSPIDIRGGLPVALEPIAFHYQAGDFSVLDTGHTVQVNVAPGNHAQLGGRRYELQQFHFHRPSEETLDGRRFDMSVHLVHADEQGRRLIVAVLVQRGSAQPVLRSVFGNLPLEKRQENRALTTLNPAELLPGEQAYFTYMGSMTTPPCSEDVQWVVLRHPVTAASEQIELFGRLYTDNIRPLQQAEGRRILQTR